MRSIQLSRSTLGPFVLCVLLAGGCGADAPSASVHSNAGVGVSTSDAAPGPALAPDRVPPQLADFPLPSDAVLIAPPRYASGRLIAGFNTDASEDDVAALFATGLDANGYEVAHVVDRGVRQWQFTKDGRQGVVNVEQNALTTVISINLMLEH